MDMVLKSDTQEIMTLLDDAQHGEVRVLKLTGILKDETPIQGSDAVVIKKKNKDQARPLDHEPHRGGARPAGRNAFTLQTVPAQEEQGDNTRSAETAGVSLHAGVTAKDNRNAPWQRHLRAACDRVLPDACILKWQQRQRHR